MARSEFGIRAMSFKPPHACVLGDLDRLKVVARSASRPRAIKGPLPRRLSESFAGDSKHFRAHVHEMAQRFGDILVIRTLAHHFQVPLVKIDVDIAPFGYRVNQPVVKSPIHARKMTRRSGTAVNRSSSSSDGTARHGAGHLERGGGGRAGVSLPCSSLDGLSGGRSHPGLFITYP